MAHYKPKPRYKSDSVRYIRLQGKDSESITRDIYNALKRCMWIKVQLGAVQIELEHVYDRNTGLWYKVTADSGRPLTIPDSILLPHIRKLVHRYMQDKL